MSSDSSHSWKRLTPSSINALVKAACVGDVVEISLDNCTFPMCIMQFLSVNDNERVLSGPRTQCQHIYRYYGDIILDSDGRVSNGASTSAPLPEPLLPHMWYQSHDCVGRDHYEANLLLSLAYPVLKLMYSHQQCVSASNCGTRWYAFEAMHQEIMMSFNKKYEDDVDHVPHSSGIHYNQMFIRLVVSSLKHLTNRITIRLSPLYVLMPITPIRV